MHHHEQPLRQQLAVGAAKLGHVGMHRQLLTGHHQVRVCNCRFDDGAAVDCLGRVNERGMMKERSNTFNAFAGAVGVLLAEIAGAHGQRGERFGAPLDTTRIHEVRHRVVAR